jgi:hypothetical protein
MISLHVATLSKQLEYTLVGSKHDGGAGYYTEHVWDKATVERSHALLFPDKTETLGKPGVLDAAVLLRCLPQSCSNDLASVSIP